MNSNNNNQINDGSGAHINGHISDAVDRLNNTISPDSFFYFFFARTYLREPPVNSVRVTKIIPVEDRFRDLRIKMLSLQNILTFNGKCLWTLPNPRAVQQPNQNHYLMQSIHHDIQRIRQAMRVLMHENNYGNPFLMQLRKIRLYLLENNKPITIQNLLNSHCNINGLVKSVMEPVTDDRATIFDQLIGALQINLNEIERIVSALGCLRKARETLCYNSRFSTHNGPRPNREH